MKNLIVACICFGMALCSISPASADPSGKTDVSSTIKAGRLQNGLAYFIERTPSSNGKIDLQLAVRVGTDFETPTTLEYPHLIEHMVFRGIGDISVGDAVAKFSPAKDTTVAALTFGQQTVFALQIYPEDSKALAAAFDFALGWTKGEGVTQQRLVEGQAAIVEEYRLRPGAMESSRRHRLIGIEWLDPSTSGTLRSLAAATLPEMQRFFDRWYRADRMILIARGDVDPDLTEKLIAQRFAALPNREMPPAETCPNQHLDGRRHIQVVDRKLGPEAAVSIRYRRHSGEEHSGLSGRSTLVAKLADAMITARTNASGAVGRDMVEQPVLVEPLPCDLVDSAMSVIARPDNLRIRFAAAYKQLATIRTYGFTSEEFETAKTIVVSDPIGPMDDFLSSYDRRENISSISLDEVNRAVAKWLSSPTQYVAISKPDSAPVSLEADIAFWMKEIDGSPVLPWVPPVKQPAPELLIAAPTAPAVSVLSSTAGLTQVEFPSAGLTLLLDVRENEPKIRFHMQRNGGYGRNNSHAAGASYFAAEAMIASGVANLDATVLEKWQREHDVRVTPFIDQWREGLYGDGGTGHLENLLKLGRAWLSQDFLSNEAWERYRAARAETKLEESIRDRFQRNVDTWIASGARPKITDADAARLQAADIVQSYRNHLGTVNGFIIAISGPLDPAETIALVGRYLGTLPKGPISPISPRAPEYREGPQKKIIEEGAPNEAQIRYYITGKAENGLPSEAAFTWLTSVLNSRLFSRLREKENGTYDVNAGAGGFVETNEFGISISFTCAPENVDTLVEAVSEELLRLKGEGFSEDERGQLPTNVEPSREPRRIVEMALRERDFPEAARRSAVRSVSAVDLEKLQSFLEPRRAQIFIQLPERLAN